MKTLKNTILLLSFFVISLPLTADDSEEVQKVFRMYRESLLDQSGKQAWEVLDSHTKSYYRGIVTDSLMLERSDLDRLDLMTKFMILRIRLEFRKEQLEQMDGEGIFTLAIKKAWISTSTVQSIKELDKVTFDNNLAQGFIAESEDIPVFYFIKEKDGWKFALYKSFELGNFAFKQMAKQSGMSDNEFIKAILEQVSKYKVSDQIFEGPIE